MTVRQKRLMQAQPLTDGRAKILQAASALFAQRGYAAVSISDVAQAAGLVKSAIYHHFESKETLFIAVLREVSRQSHLAMEQAAQGETWRARLRAATRALSALTRPQSHILNLILGGVTSPIADDHRAEKDESLREFTAVLRREISAGIAAGDLRRINPELASICLIGLVISVLQWEVALKEEERVAFAFELFVSGIEKKKRN